MQAVDPYARTIRQAAHDAVRALLTTAPDSPEGAPAVDLTYAAVWVLSLLAAIRTLFGEGGLRVAVLAIVLIVLLAPPALGGIQALLRRRRTPEASPPPAAAP